MKNYSFLRFQLKELYLALKLIIDFLNPLQEQHPEVVPLLTKLTVLFTKFDIAVKRKRTSDFTADKKELDEKQDDGYLCFRSYVLACTYSILNPEFRAPANRVLEAIRRHGWSLNSLSYKAQTAASLSLINELQRASLADDLTAIGAEDVFNAWVDAVDAFRSVNQQMLAEQANSDDESATEMKKEVIYWLDKTLHRIEDMVVWNDSQVWSDVKGKVEAGLDDIYSNIKARQTRKENEVEAPEETQS